MQKYNIKDFKECTDANGTVYYEVWVCSLSMPYNKKFSGNFRRNVKPKILLVRKEGLERSLERPSYGVGRGVKKLDNGVFNDDWDFRDNNGYTNFFPGKYACTKCYRNMCNEFIGEIERAKIAAIAKFDKCLEKLRKIVG